eukprot:4946464-Lingulodinium_polyedra.AAC.1
MATGARSQPWLRIAGRVSVRPRMRRRASPGNSASRGTSAAGRPISPRIECTARPLLVVARSCHRRADP